MLTPPVLDPRLTLSFHFTSQPSFSPGKGPTLLLPLRPWKRTSKSWPSELLQKTQMSPLLSAVCKKASRPWTSEELPTKDNLPGWQVLESRERQGRQERQSARREMERGTKRGS